MGDKLKTTRQTADELSVSLKQVRRFVKDGELVAIDVGQGQKRECLRFEDEAIADFKLRRQRQRETCLPSTKTKNRNTTKPTSGSTVLNFLAQQRKRASEKQAAKLAKSKSD